MSQLYARVTQLYARVTETEMADDEETKPEVPRKYPFGPRISPVDFAKKGIALSQSGWTPIDQPHDVALMRGISGPGEPMVFQHRDGNLWNRPQYLLLFTDGTVFVDADTQHATENRLSSYRWLHENLAKALELAAECESQEIYDTVVKMIVERQAQAKTT